MRASLIALALAAACSPAAAMEHPATAGTLMRVFAAARDGDVIRLQGDFPLVVLQGRTFARPVTIDAGKAKLTSIVVKNVTGLEWDGGRFQPADRPAFSLDGAQGVTLRQLDVVGDGHQNGVIIRDSRDVTLADSRFD
ncbi:MAG TPA: hypothetical protein VFH92_07420, partial [Phenylobacterium sp.]|nr:hypothetical protein [Phenylobacterium sp.]